MPVLQESETLSERKDLGNGIFDVGGVDKLVGNGAKKLGVYV